MGSDDPPHGNLKQLFDTVTKDARRCWIYRQETALQIVGAQQILTVFHKVSIPVFVFL
jgi:hypothetical protein